jgi:hypothetical protein
VPPFREIVMWIGIAVGVAAALGGLVALRLLAEAGGPWAWIVWTLVGICGVSIVTKKLFSEAPVDDDWYGHIRWLVAGASGALLGLPLAATGSGWERLLGLLLFAFGVVSLVAEYRDLTKWREAVEREREEAAEQAQIEAEAPRPRAWGGPPVNRPPTTSSPEPSGPPS